MFNNFLVMTATDLQNFVDILHESDAIFKTGPDFVDLEGDVFELFVEQMIQVNHRAKNLDIRDPFIYERTIAMVTNGAGPVQHKSDAPDGVMYKIKELHWLNNFYDFLFNLFDDATESSVAKSMALHMSHDTVDDSNCHCS